ncbi:hypothetical protein VKT23_014425 [Stygiomarasmius scandens]|uniref:Uncharacterized protein n=1 Tax=Marasmiellus scandens TaxID=2682957 RepID=A0ABR1J0Y1_9AGAR
MSSQSERSETPTPLSSTVDETTSLLSNGQKPSDHQKSYGWPVILVSVLGLAIGIAILVCLLILLITGRRNPQSASTAAWANLTASEICHSIGIREYSASLVDVTDGWDPIVICNQTSITIHGKRIEKPVSCTFNSAGLAQGSWLVDYKEQGCFPTWSVIHYGDCVDYGTRSYYAHLDYVPPGLSHLESCKATSADFHGESLAPDRCELVVDPASQDGRLVVRGDWVVGFEEDECIPTWQGAMADQCVSYATRSYHADLNIPRGLEKVASSLCSGIPTSIHSRDLFPTRCEALGGSPEAVVRGYWDVDFAEPGCMPEWTNIRADDQCSAYDSKRYTAILSGVPKELDSLKTCRQVPQEFSGVEKKPKFCDWDDHQDKVVGSWFLGVAECRPDLKDIKDYGCIEREDGYRRIEGEVVDIGKDEDWYKLCTTMPYHSNGETHFPFQCESRTSWGITRRYALYNIPSLRCRNPEPGNESE